MGWLLVTALLAVPSLAGAQQAPADRAASASASNLASNLAADPTSEGLAHFEAERFEAAVACFRRALEVQPEDPALLGWLGMALLQAGHTHVAVQTLKRAVALAPNVADHHVRLGHAHRATGHLYYAKVAYQRALALAPDDESARHGIAELDQGRLRARKAEAPTEHGQRVISYRDLLIGGYVVAPLLVAGVGLVTWSPLALLGFLIPSAIHGAHGQVGRALLSPVGMTGLSLLGAYLGTELLSCSGNEADGYNCSQQAIILGVAGYMLWAGIDIALFSEFTVEGGNGSGNRNRNKAPVDARASVTLAPLLSHEGAGLQLTWVQ